MRPRAACFKEAARHTIPSHQRILTLEEMRSCLGGGFLFVLAFTVYESFEPQKVAGTGATPIPKPREQVL